MSDLGRLEVDPSMDSLVAWFGESGDNDDLGAVAAMRVDLCAVYLGLMTIAGRRSRIYSSMHAKWRESDKLYIGVSQWAPLVRAWA